MKKHRVLCLLRIYNKRLCKPNLFKKKGKNVSKPHVIVTPLYRQVNKSKATHVQIRAFKKIVNQRKPHPMDIKADIRTTKKKRKTNFVYS